MYCFNYFNYECFVFYWDMGIKIVLNLCGKMYYLYYYFEVESCEKLGMSLIDILMSVCIVFIVDMLVELMDIFESLFELILMYCKLGVDWIGIVVVIYLMYIFDCFVEEVCKMLFFDFFYIKFLVMGILDYVIDKYVCCVENEFIFFRIWVVSEYEFLIVCVEFDVMGFWD